MARAFYSYEVGDQDLDWLISNFLGEHPEYLPIENGNLPIVLLPQIEEEWIIAEDDAALDFFEEDFEDIA